MADYRELLRRAIEALPENNGAARRAVYEKARAALVGQLRAINPPLPARDITTHRLQLEDCIRQVEQEASEANIAGMGGEPPAPPILPPVFAGEAKKPAPKAGPAAHKPEAHKPEPVAHKPEPAPRGGAPHREVDDTDDTASIEDIIVAAERDRAPRAKASETPEISRPEIKSRPPKSQPVLVARSDPPDEAPRPAKPEHRPLPAIVARAEAAKGRTSGPGFGVAVDASRRGPTIEPRRERGSGLAATARQIEPIEFDVPDDVQAMSAVREVEVEPHPAESQGVIDRAIATLDREARGEAQGARFEDGEGDADDAPLPAPARARGLLGKARPGGKPAVAASEREGKPPRPAREFANPRRAQAARAFDGVPRAQPERGGMGAVTIFLIIFAVLLAGAGGAGFWAWQEGYINLDAMFGKGAPVVTTAAAEPAVTPDSTGPGNTETPPAVTEPANQLKADEQLPATPVAAAPATEAVAPLALQSPTGDSKIEARLGGDTGASAEAAAAAVAALDPTSAPGSQSLLLEASDNGTTGAVPFSGTVDWSKGTDELGQPTLIGKANIPARNLSVELLIRRNSDPSLPASHLMEINFTVPDSFIGGSIAGLPGVLLKNEELVQGAPLVGASARVVGNSFLFALSAAPEDSTANTTLLTSRKWMDLALIYASGKRAIITLEKDAEAQALFTEVFGAWSKAAAAG